MKKGSRSNKHVKHARSADTKKKEERLMSVGTFSSTRAMGDLIKTKFDGEEGATGRFVGYLAVGGVAGSNRTALTFSSVFTAVNQGFLTKLWNTGGTGIYANCRLTEVSLTVAPMIDQLAQRSLSGGYAMTAPRASASVPAGLTDLLQLEDSMLYVAPLREATTYTISAMPFCTRPGRTLTYRAGGTEKPWIGAGASPPGFLTQTVADVYYFGLGTGVETSYVFFSAKFDFKGFNPT
jgi:hypothetical protein